MIDLEKREFNFVEKAYSCIKLRMVILPLSYFYNINKLIFDKKVVTSITKGILDTYYIELAGFGAFRCFIRILKFSKKLAKKI